MMVWDILLLWLRASFQDSARRFVIQLYLEQIYSSFVCRCDMTRRSTEDGLGKFLKTKLSEFIKFCCKKKKWSDPGGKNHWIKEHWIQIFCCVCIILFSALNWILRIENKIRDLLLYTRLYAKVFNLNVFLSLFKFNSSSLSDLYKRGFASQY